MPPGRPQPARPAKRLSARLRPFYRGSPGAGLQGIHELALLLLGGLRALACGLAATLARRDDFALRRNPEQHQRVLDTAGHDRVVAVAVHLVDGGLDIAEVQRVAIGLAEEIGKRLGVQLGLVLAGAHEGLDKPLDVTRPSGLAVGVGTRQLGLVLSRGNEQVCETDVRHLGFLSVVSFPTDTLHPNVECRNLPPARHPSQGPPAIVGPRPQGPPDAAGPRTGDPKAPLGLIGGWVPYIAAEVAISVISYAVFIPQLSLRFPFAPLACALNHGDKAFAHAARVWLS